MLMPVSMLMVNFTGAQQPVSKMKKIIILMLAIILVLPLIIAEPSYVYKINSPINLKVPILNPDNSLTNSSTLCRITIKYPNETILVNNSLMTYNVGYYNYTIESIDTLGEFTTFVNCNDGINFGFTSFSFEITPNGTDDNLTFFIVLGLIALVVFLIALYSGNEYIMFISSGIIILLGVYSLIYGIGNFYDEFSRMISIVFISIGIFFLIISSLKAIAEVSEEKTIGGFGPGGEDYDYYNS